MKILIACEYSGRLRDAFLDKGHDAHSCDLLPTESPRPAGRHHTGDVLPLLEMYWDIVIAFPPCTRLCYSGIRWWPEYPGEQDLAVEFFMRFTDCAERVAIENPRGIMSKRYRPADQVVNPYYFGDAWTKETHLWLKGLPPLMSTDLVTPHEGSRIWKMGPSPDRAKKRSLIPQGLANAMADQWG